MANKRTVQNGIDAGKPCSVSEGHFPGRENLARFPRDISPGGKTLLGFRGTFSRAGKPCSVSEEHFPEWENLARFPRDISPGGKTLLGSRGTFSQAGKPCPARGERFPGREKLAALRGRLSTIICSPPSFPIRPHQGVCDTPLQFLAKYLHETTPSITVSPTNKW